jgi:anti-anti-sigma factor
MPRSALAETRVADDGGVLMVTVEGEIDISNVQLIEDQVIDLGNDALGLVLDLAAVSFIDSATIRMLFKAHKRLARRGQDFIVVSLDDSPIRRVLELTGYPKEEEMVQTSAEHAAKAIRARQKPAG